ncbi:MAG: hypothetical protein M0018_02745 [Nitrospiraceae bacterium]|nr:hypothetical protein [Nitrospiraceae bacterium]
MLFEKMPRKLEKAAGEQRVFKSADLNGVERQKLKNCLISASCRFWFEHLKKRPCRGFSQEEPRRRHAYLRRCTISDQISHPPHQMKPGGRVILLEGRKGRRSLLLEVR